MLDRPEFKGLVNDIDAKASLDGTRAPRRRRRRRAVGRIFWKCLTAAFFSHLWSTFSRRLFSIQQRWSTSRSTVSIESVLSFARWKMLQNKTIIVSFCALCLWCGACAPTALPLVCVCVCVALAMALIVVRSVMC